IRYHARVLDVLGAQLEQRAAAGANRRLGEVHLAVPHDSDVQALAEAMQVPDEHAQGAAGGDVGRDAQPHGGHGQWHHVLEAMRRPTPRPEGPPSPSSFALQNAHVVYIEKRAGGQVSGVRMSGSGISGKLRVGLNGARSTSVSPFVSRSPMTSPVSAASSTPL